jgi:hypothetical protein
MNEHAIRDSEAVPFQKAECVSLVVCDFRSAERVEIEVGSAKEAAASVGKLYIARLPRSFVTNERQAMPVAVVGKDPADQRKGRRFFHCPAGLRFVEVTGVNLPGSRS